MKPKKETNESYIMEKGKIKINIKDKTNLINYKIHKII